jgi:hypothetical protein
MLCLQWSDTGWHRGDGPAGDAGDHTNDGEIGDSTAPDAGEHSGAREANDSASRRDTSAAASDAAHAVAFGRYSIGACCAGSDARHASVHSVANADISAGLHASAACAGDSAATCPTWPCGDISASTYAGTDI